MTKTALILTLPTMLLAASLAACGGDDKPAVCGSVDDLKSSVQSVKDVDVTTSSGLSDLESALTTVKDDLASVKADATSEFSSQIDTVETSYSALTSTVDKAKTSPSATTLSATASALSTFNTDAQSLISDVESTC